MIVAPQGITIGHAMNGSEIVDALSERILGRFLAADLCHMQTGDVIVAAGDMVTEDHLEKIQESGNDQAYVRSVLVCESNVGVCAHVTDATLPEAQM